jgi:outer membrane protein assembly factor BamB
LTKSHVAWRARSRGAYIPSPICYGGRYYFVEDNGWGNCLDPATGKEIWRQRLGGNYRASPVAGDGKIYFTNLEGVVTVVKSAPEFEVLSRNDMQEALTASPAISGSQIFLRGEKHLFCVGKR